jgi:ISXO2-like transposase domain/Transposase zinc-ribbon domain
MEFKKRPPQTLQEAIRYFSNSDTCLEFMVELRWPDGVTCPTCDSKDVRFLATRRLWECKTKHPKRQFSGKVGTIFEDSPIPLEKWFTTMWMLANCKNGVSSYEVHRAIKVTQKSAWFMLHRIRLAMQVSGGKLGGPGSTVEVDETWIGGTARSMNRGRTAKTKTNHKIGPYARSGKAIVLGMLERGGRVALRVVKNVRRATLIPEIRDHVEEGTEIHSDALPSYLGLEERSYETLGQARYTHKIVDHAIEYVNADCHVLGGHPKAAMSERGKSGQRR